MRTATSPLKLIAVLGLLSVFVGSFSALGLMGFGIGDENAGLLARMHPAFYFLSFALIVDFIIRANIRPNSRMDARVAMHGRMRTAYACYTATVLGALVLSLIGLTYGSIMNTATTFLLPSLCILSLTRLDERQLRIIRNILLFIMLANSTIGIIEKTFDYRLMPYTIGTEEKLNDPRPTAWFSHPLNNAVLTSIFLVYLLYSPKARQLGALRLPMIAVHSYALICFGGRTAVVALLLVLALDYLATAVRAVSQKKGVVKLWVQTALIAISVAIVLIAASYGFFDDLIERFRDDGGSANVRWDSFALIRDLDLTSILWGYSNADFDSSLNYYGIRTIEFSWLYLILKNGLIIGAVLLISMCVLLQRASGLAGRPAGYMAFLLVLITFGYTSLASASLLLSQFFILVAALQQTSFRVSKPAAFAG